ncbi:MAG: type II secretion system F family protein [Candidatus Riflebacteria bacterium]|nr:type II secretion system F family protein [Candidatus Riflebacteria bacterium]
MNGGSDQGLFPQSLLRFIAVCGRLKTPPHEALRIYMSTFRLSHHRRFVLESVKKGLAVGSTLADELGRAGDLFPRWLAPLIRWGQKTGGLELSLERAAALLDLEARVDRALRVNLIYPICLLTAAILLAVYSLVSPVLRSLASVTDMLAGKVVFTFDQEWPLAAWLIKVSGWCAEQPVLVSLVLLGGWGTIVLMALVPDMVGHRTVRRWVLATIPQASQTREMVHGALQARLLADGVVCSVPLHDALELIAPLSPTRRLDDRLVEVAGQLRSGARPEDVLTSGDEPGGFYAGMCLALTSPGTVPALADLARRFEEEARAGVESLGRPATPVLTVAAALVVALVPLAHFLDVLRLTAITVALLS